jgi:2-iminobutanoate/2-iminopropanoate deaminase
MRQKSIEVEGLGHSVPIPLACRVGQILATSGINGKDRKTGKMPPDAASQAVQCFENLKAVLAEGGCDIGDVVKLTVYVADEAHRDAIAKLWLDHFPDAHQRPARHAVVSPLRGGALIQLEALAVAKDA